MQTTDYLVKHGRLACVGRFRSLAGVAFAHGDRVVLRSPKGLEIGTVLSEASARFAHLLDEAALGDIVRTLTHADECREAELDLFARQLLDEAQTAADSLGLNLAILDLEIPLEGGSAILQVLPGAEDGDLSRLVETLSRRHDMSFAILDLRHKPAAEEDGGCGKPGCGSSGGGGCSSCGTGGGCSTGSCSKGSVKSAEELTAYFADLRRQMEAQETRVALFG